MNKRNIILIVVLVNIILGASIVTLYFTVFNKNGGTPDDWTLTLKGDIDQDVTLKIDDLYLMPNITRDYIIQGTPTFTAEYTGVSLYYLVTQKANISVPATIKVRAIDQYSKSLTMDEINTTRDIIIAFKKNGENITHHSDGGEGPLRLIIPQMFEGDYNGQYCVKFVSEIEIKVI